MRRSWIATTIVITLATLVGAPADAQDQNNSDQLRRQLADAVGQLKAAQDRKNELANENDKLRAELAATQYKLGELSRDAADWAERTYALRAEHAAWLAFIQRYPRLKAQWEVLQEAGPLVQTDTMQSWWDGTAMTTTAPSAKPATTRAATTSSATSRSVMTTNSATTRSQ